MNFKNAILTKLVTKYPGLSKHLLGLIADKLAAKVTEESQIDDAVSGLDDSPIPIPEYARILQQEGDRRVTDAQRTWQEQGGKGSDNPNSAEKDKGVNDPIAKLNEKIDGLLNTVANMQKQGTQQTLSERLNARLKEKSIPLFLSRNYTLEKEEDIETAFAAIEADHTAYKQELANQGFNTNTPPGGGGVSNADKTKVEAEITAWAAQSKPATQTQTK